LQDAPEGVDLDSVAAALVGRLADPHAVAELVQPGDVAVAPALEAATRRVLADPRRRQRAAGERRLLGGAAPGALRGGAGNEERAEHEAERQKLNEAHPASLPDMAVRRGAA